MMSKNTAAANALPTGSRGGSAGWSWQEWFAVICLTSLGALVSLTDSAWGLVVLIPALVVLALGCGCELAGWRARRS